MLPQCSHIARKRGVYFFRRRLPSPLAGEVALSLRTTSYLRAEHLATRLTARFEALIATAMTSDDLKPILRAYLQDELTKLRNSLLMASYKEAYFTKDWRAHHDTPAEADREVIERMTSILRTELRRRTPASLEPIVRRLADAHQIPVGRERELGLGVTQAYLQVLEQADEWLREGITSKIDLTEPEARQAVPNQVQAPSSFDPSPAGPAISAVLPNFIDLMVSTGEWTGQTKAQNEASYRMFIGHCGDRSVQTYTRRDLASFHDVLRRLPALYAKRADLRGQSLAEVVDKTRDEAVERLAMKTVKRHFSALGRLFDHLKERGEYEGANPAHGFEFPGAKGRASEKRRMWEGEKLTRLFSSPVWSGCLSEARRSRPGAVIIKDEKYWLPILGLYHGNRLEEFAQLKGGDVRQADGIWYFDVNDEGEKQLKNEQSRRRVPLHPVLHDLGFLDYVRQTAPGATDPLFPNLRPGGADNKLGFYFTKWWSQYRRDVGLYEKGLDYHSFRHGVTTKLFAADVQEAFIDHLTGHEGTTTSRKVYLKGLPLAALHTAISTVRWSEVPWEQQTNAAMPGHHPVADGLPKE